MYITQDIQANVTSNVFTQTVVTKLWRCRLERGGIIQFLDSCQPYKWGVESATHTVVQTRIQRQWFKGGRVWSCHTNEVQDPDCGFNVSDAREGGFDPVIQTRFRIQIVIHTRLTLNPCLNDKLDPEPRLYDGIKSSLPCMNDVESLYVGRYEWPI